MIVYNRGPNPTETDSPVYYWVVNSDFNKFWIGLIILFYLRRVTRGRGLKSCSTFLLGLLFRWQIFQDSSLGGFHPRPRQVPRGNLVYVGFVRLTYEWDTLRQTFRRGRIKGLISSRVSSCPWLWLFRLRSKSMSALSSTFRPTFFWRSSGLIGSSGYGCLGPWDRPSFWPWIGVIPCIPYSGNIIRIDGGDDNSNDFTKGPR